MNTSCNISSRTTCRRPIIVQQDLPAAQQQQQQQQQQPRHAAAASCRSNKQQKAPTSRISAVYLVRCSAPAGISTLIFSLSSSSASKQNNKNEIKMSDFGKLFCSKFSRAKLTLASCSLRISITTRPAAQSQLHSNDQGKVQP